MESITGIKSPFPRGRESAIWDAIDDMSREAPEFDKFDFFETLNFFTEKAYGQLIREDVKVIMRKLGLVRFSGNWAELTDFGRTVLEHGGYMEYQKWREREFWRNVKLDELQESAVRSTLKTNQWLLRTKWWPLALSSLALLFSILALAVVFSDGIE